MQNGLLHWRSRPPVKPNAVVFADVGRGVSLPVGRVEDMYSSEALKRGTPVHSLALLSLAPADMPVPGEVRSVRVDQEALGTSGGTAQLEALDYAASKGSGVIGCVANIEDANGLPWGAVACEVLDTMRFGEGEALVKLKALASVRLVSACPADRLNGFVVAPVQEVPEWGSAERAAGIQDFHQEVQELERIFDNCGKLQAKGAQIRAGDFLSMSLAERTEEVLATLEGVPLLVEPPAPRVAAAAARMATGGNAALSADAAADFATAPEGAKRLVAAVHAVVGALSPDMRMKFICDPVSVAPRLKRVRELLTKVEKLVRARLAFRRAFDD